MTSITSNKAPESPIYVYVYTLTDKAGFKEYRGVIKRRSYFGGIIIDHLDSNKYWTGLSPKEGVVRGKGVWYTEPSREKAIKAFQERKLDQAIDFITKSTNAFQEATK